MPSPTASFRDLISPTNITFPSLTNYGTENIHSSMSGAGPSASSNHINNNDTINNNNDIIEHSQGYSIHSYPYLRQFPPAQSQPGLPPSNDTSTVLPAHAYRAEHQSPHDTSARPYEQGDAGHGYGPSVGAGMGYRDPPNGGMYAPQASGSGLRGFTVNEGGVGGGGRGEETYRGQGQMGDGGVFRQERRDRSNGDRGEEMRFDFGNVGGPAAESSTGGQYFYQSGGPSDPSANPGNTVRYPPQRLPPLHTNTQPDLGHPIAPAPFPSISPSAIAAAVMNRASTARSSPPPPRSNDVYVDRATSEDPAFGLDGLNLSQLGLSMGSRPFGTQGLSREQQVDIFQYQQQQQQQQQQIQPYQQHRQQPNQPTSFHPQMAQGRAPANPSMLVMAGYDTGQDPGRSSVYRPNPQQLSGSFGLAGAGSQIAGGRGVVGQRAFFEPGSNSAYASGMNPDFVDRPSGPFASMAQTAPAGIEERAQSSPRPGPDQYVQSEQPGSSVSVVGAGAEGVGRSYAHSGGGGSISALSDLAMYARTGKGRGGSGTIPGSSEYGDERGEDVRSEKGGRRDRKAGEKDEDITTIFIVGLPDDLTEREFSNMFTFAPGFEAAMLKVPAGTRPTASGFGSMLPNGTLDEPRSAHTTGDPAGETTLSKVRSAESTDEGSLNPGSSSASLVDGSSASYPIVRTSSGLPSATRRSGVLGFARFRTKADALVARDVLRGRKFDSTATSGLKVEMAKKNLHAKRSIGNEELVGMLVRSGKLPGILAGIGLAGAQLAPISSASQSNFGSRASTPATKSGVRASAVNAPNGMEIEDSIRSGRRQTEDQWPDESGEQGGMQGEPSGDRRRMQTYPSQSVASSRPYVNASSNRREQGVPLSAERPPMNRSIDSKALLALAEEADGSEDWNVVGRGMDNLGAFDNESRMPSPYPLEKSSGWPAQGEPSSFGRDGDSFVSPPTGPPILYPRQSNMGNMGGNKADSAIGPLNMADQNPPINTLYVGNLPPHEAFLEDVLRALFCQAPGFRRMSFRQKINGPMCFVEFEDIPLATQAMKDLYAHTLGGMVKGGLRLAYSRNPLGQRGGVGAGPGSRRVEPPAPLFPYGGGGSLTYQPNGIPTPAIRQGSLSGHVTQDSISANNDQPFRPSRRPSEGSAGLSPHATPFSSSLNHHLTMSPASNAGLYLHDAPSPTSPRGLFMTPWVSSHGTGGVGNGTTISGGMSTFGSIPTTGSTLVGTRGQVESAQPVYRRSNSGQTD